MCYGNIISSVSSSIELTSSVFEDITYVMPADKSANFYKLSIVNLSWLKIQNVIFNNVQGLFLYVSGSTIEITD